MLTKSAGWPLVKVTHTVCLPVTPDMPAGMLVQFCQPPVLATENDVTGAFDRLSRRTSTRPLMPPPAPEATRPQNVCAAEEPKSTLSNCNQSPLAIQPTSCPPPVGSAHVSVCVPDWAL